MAMGNGVGDTLTLSMPAGPRACHVVGAPPRGACGNLPRDPRAFCTFSYLFWPTSLVAHVAICHVKNVAHVAMLSRFGKMWTVLLVAHVAICHLAHEPFGP